MLEVGGKKQSGKQILTLRMSNRLLKRVDQLVESGEFKSRGEVLKTAMREMFKGIGIPGFRKKRKKSAAQAAAASAGTSKGKKIVSLRVPQRYKQALQMLVAGGIYDTYSEAIRESVKRLLGKMRGTCPRRRRKAQTAK